MGHIGLGWDRGIGFVFSVQGVVSCRSGAYTWKAGDGGRGYCRGPQEEVGHVGGTYPGRRCVEAR